MSEPVSKEIDDRPVVAVANRLPVQHGEHGWELSPGGLVTALRPVMSTHSGAWVGWDGGAKGMPSNLPDSGVRLLPISLSSTQVRNYYYGFSNATLWPLLHYAIEKPRFERAWWHSYRDVNGIFANQALDALEEYPDAMAWVHDYQLMMVPQLIRERRPDQPIGFFLHVPWPSPDIFARLPWREQILTGLLGADVVSFHTEHYRSNFVRAVARLLSGSGIEVRGSTIALPDGRLVETTAAPISIDVADFTKHATEPETSAEVDSLREQFAGRTLLLGVDRLDYTKGILHRLNAYGELLDEKRLGPKPALIQVASPSRERVDAYRALRDDVEVTVGRINGEHGEVGYSPVHYLHQSYPREEMAALYLAGDVMLVTPLRDGMNLVAKEYVACRNDENGALVLSEFTGAADELAGAFLVNPHDIEGMKDAIVRAANTGPAEARRRMRAMRRRVREHDVARWAASFLDSLSEAPGADRPAWEPEAS